MNATTLRRSILLTAVLFTLPLAARAQCPGTPPPGNSDIPTCDHSTTPDGQALTMFHVPVRTLIREPLVSVVTWYVAKPRQLASPRAGWTVTRPRALRAGR